MASYTVGGYIFNDTTLPGNVYSITQFLQGQGKGSNWDLFANQYLFQDVPDLSIIPIDCNCIELRFIPKEEIMTHCKR